MLRVESNTNLEHLEQDLDGFTEFEDDIHFDSDDPDFEHRGSLHDIFFGGKLYLLLFKLLVCSGLVGREKIFRNVCECCFFWEELITGV